MKVISKILFIGFIFIVNTSNAQTVIDTSQVSGTWTKINSPYLIYNDITIPDSATLTIEPGVRVEFRGYYKLNVQGRILALGSINDTILFTTNDTTGLSDITSENGSWNGIEFINTPLTNDTSKFQYCKFEYGKSIDPEGNGGALYAGSTFKIFISNCVFQNNLSSSSGGAVSTYGLSHSLIVNECTFRNNSSFIGGGLYLGGQDFQFSNNRVYNNHSGRDGGGLRVIGDGVLKNNFICNNTSDIWAAGIELNGYSTLIDNVICNNTSLGWAGGLLVEKSPTLFNNTICNNFASQRGGGIEFNHADSAILKNNIIWGNNSPYAAQVYIGAYSRPEFYNCDIEDGLSGFGYDGTSLPYTFNYDSSSNINVDPKFVDPTPYAGTDYDGLSSDWSLTNRSVCINSGIHDTTGLNLPDLDLAGNPRIYNGNMDIVDIGAYEYQGHPAPNDIELSNDSIPENSPPATIVGIINTQHQDSTAVITCSFSADSTLINDTSYFYILGDTLFTKTNELDFEKTPQLTLNITCSDNWGNDLTKEFTIYLKNLNDNMPYVQDSIFTLDENSPPGIIVGSLLGNDGDNGIDSLTYTIISGNSDTAFSIDAKTGEISAIKYSALDYEIHPEFDLGIDVSDGVFTHLCNVKIKLNNRNDNAPYVENTTFRPYENRPKGFILGTIVANDGDEGLDSLTYSIISGNSGNAFSINPKTGEISLNDSSALNYENYPEYSQSYPLYNLGIEVSDGIFTSQGNIKIYPKNLNDNAPNIEEASFTLYENSPNGFIVGTVIADDGDYGLDSLTYSIISGNADEAFSINPKTGEISVNNSSALDYEVRHGFVLDVEVSDGLYKTDAWAFITLRNVWESKTEQISKDEISVYPNPVSKEVTIKVPGNELLNVYISNSNGVVLLNYKMLNTKSINLEMLPSGIYYIHIQGYNRVYYYKILKY